MLRHRIVPFDGTRYDVINFCSGGTKRSEGRERKRGTYVHYVLGAGKNVTVRMTGALYASEYVLNVSHFLSPRFLFARRSNEKYVSTSFNVRRWRMPGEKSVLHRLVRAES